MLLSKGFEIEIYTGNSAGEIIGLSDQIVRDLDGFVREPDNRNVEYTTAPLSCYERLVCALLKPRVHLREYLHSKGDYTLIPGSTLSLGKSDRFYRSDPNNPYHSYIENTYGTKVVTASVHINIGISSEELLMRACRLVRLEAPLYLALSASSPFLDGQVTGAHSTRWQMFPKTPQEVPLFSSHGHFIQWTEEQLKKGTMQNVRHLWSSVRPNGDRRPYILNRLELRICDLVTHPLHLLAITALLEARIHQVIENPDLDPLKKSKLSPEELVEITNQNEIAAAVSSLNAQLRHWEDGGYISATTWIEQLYQEALPIAERKGFINILQVLTSIIREGNCAQRWIKEWQGGKNVQEIIQGGIQELTQEELLLEGKICQELQVA